MSVLKQGNGVELLHLRVPLRIISKKNSKARNRYTGQPFLSREMRTLQTAIERYARQRTIIAEPYRGTVVVEIVAHFVNGVHADVGNLSEIILDGMQGVVYRNDKQVGTLLVVSCECGEDAVTIRVRTTDRQVGACVDA